MIEGADYLGKGFESVRLMKWQLPMRKIIRHLNVYPTLLLNEKRDEKSFELPLFSDNSKILTIKHLCHFIV